MDLPRKETIASPVEETSSIELLKLDHNKICFSSLRQFENLTRLDFGFGGNSFFSVNHALGDLFYIMDDCNDGINVYCNIKKSEVDLFLNDKELKKYISWSSY